MTDRQSISIIVPVYNAEKYLKRCIESILVQSYKNFELILVDDGSTDGSSGICDEYGKMDNITVLHIKNSGVSNARNIGIAGALGEYVAFIDADDYVGEKYLENLYGAIQKDKTDICVCGYRKVYDQEERKVVSAHSKGVYQGENILPLIQEMIGYSYDDMKKWLCYKDFSRGTVVWRHLYRKCLLDENEIVFDENIKVAEDMIFNLQAYTKAKAISVIDYDEYYYVQNPNSALHCYLSENYSYLVSNKVYLAKERKRIADNTATYDLRSMYVGSLVLSCMEIAISVTKNTHIHWKNKLTYYRKYRYLAEVNEAVKGLTLDGISFKNKCALFLVKSGQDCLLFIALMILQKMGKI